MEQNAVMTAGNVLRETRKRANLTVVELAYKAKVSASTITSCEAHDIPPGEMSRWRISRVLGIPAATLFPGTPPFTWETTTAAERNKRREEQAELRRRVPGHVTPPGLLDGEKLKP